MPLAISDMVWTTGVGDNAGFISAGNNAKGYNGETARYDYLHELTGKRIFVDTSFGASQQADSWSRNSASTLNERIAEGVSNSAGANVSIEHAGIEHEDLNEGRQAKLAGLQQHVQIVHLLKEGHLGPVHFEPDPFAFLVRDPVEIVQTPAPVRELINCCLEVRGSCH
jgi:hypothetical protein